MELSVFFQGGSDDEGRGIRQEVGDIVEGGTTSDEEGCPWGCGVGPSEVFRVGSMAGTGAAEDEGIGSAAFPGIAGFVLDGVAWCERGGVLDVDIGEDSDFFRPDFPPGAEKFFRHAGEDALVSHAGPDKNVDADEIGPDGMGHGQSSDPVITEKIDAQRAGKKLPGLRGEGGQRSDGGGCGGSGQKGGISEIFQYHAMSPPGFQSLQIPTQNGSGIPDFSGIARGTGKGRKMDHPDQGGKAWKKGELIHGAILGETDLTGKIGLATRRNTCLKIP